MGRRKKIDLTKIEKIKSPKTTFQNVKGMNDILPKDQFYWQIINDVGRKIAKLRGYYFIETPTLEPANLFKFSVGQYTDIVEKEMFVFETKGKDLVALKPENTASVMRAYLQHQLNYFSLPLKVFYFDRFFRYEKPQHGRERQFHQFGFEILGDSDPVYDAETILTAYHFFDELKIKNIKVRINTLGCKNCRLNYKNNLKAYYKKHKRKLCKDCQKRYQKNILRLLDCKEESCQVYKKEAPIILDYLCNNCNNHFKVVLEVLEDNGIFYEPDPYLVRGLDYYNRTVFEFNEIPPEGDSQLNFELGGGGRYDYLSEYISKKEVPAVGFALGVERIIELLKVRNIKQDKKEKVKIFFVAVGEQAKKSALKYIHLLRINNFIVDEALGRNSLKAQMKMADRVKANISLILGQREIYEGTIIFRDMTTGVQENLILNNLVEEIKNKMKLNKD